MTTETRTAVFEMRNAEVLDVEKRIMTLLLAPYGEVSMLTEHRNGERFVKGAFRKACAEFRGRRTPLYLFRSHNHDRAVGRALTLSDTTDGPLGEFRVASTSAGDEVVSEYKEGLLSSVSIGFRAILDTLARDGVREVREAAILEASVAPIGAYEGARVLEYRTPDDLPDLSQYRVPPPPRIDPSQPWGRRG